MSQTASALFVSLFSCSSRQTQGCPSGPEKNPAHYTRISFPGLSAAHPHSPQQSPQSGYFWIALSLFLYYTFFRIHKRPKLRSARLRNVFSRRAATIVKRIYHGFSTLFSHLEQIEQQSAEPTAGQPDSEKSQKRHRNPQRQCRLHGTSAGEIRTAPGLHSVRWRPGDYNLPAVWQGYVPVLGVLHDTLHSVWSDNRGRKGYRSLDHSRGYLSGNHGRVRARCKLYQRADGNTLFRCHVAYGTDYVEKPG